MNNSAPTHSPAASSLPAGKITRKQLAAFYGLSVRTIDELTSRGVLAHFKIGKSIRYDFAETEAALRERYHVGARAQTQTVEGRCNGNCSTPYCLRHSRLNPPPPPQQPAATSSTTLTQPAA